MVVNGVLFYTQFPLFLFSLEGSIFVELFTLRYSLSWSLRPRLQSQARNKRKRDHSVHIQTRENGSPVTYFHVRSLRGVEWRRLRGLRACNKDEEAGKEVESWGGGEEVNYVQV